MEVTTARATAIAEGVEIVAMAAAVEADQAVAAVTEAAGTTVQARAAPAPTLLRNGKHLLRRTFINLRPP